VVGVSADSLDIARGIGERDGEAFSDRPKTGVRDDPGFDPPLSFDARQSLLTRMTVPDTERKWRHGSLPVAIEGIPEKFAGIPSYP
jgi:hypothetical protein